MSISQHQIEANERKLARITVIFLIKDAFDLSEWYHTGQYHPRYYLQFGFSKNAPRETAWNRVAERIRYFANSRVFQTFCKIAGAEPSEARQLIDDLLSNQGDRNRIKNLLEEYKEEISLYAKRGRTPKKAS